MQHLRYATITYVYPVTCITKPAMPLNVTCTTYVANAATARGAMGKLLWQPCMLLVLFISMLSLIPPSSIGVGVSVGPDGMVKQAAADGMAVRPARRLAALHARLARPVSGTVVSEGAMTAVEVEVTVEWTPGDAVLQVDGTLLVQSVVDNTASEPLVLPPAREGDPVLIDSVSETGEGAQVRRVTVDALSPRYRAAVRQWCERVGVDVDGPACAAASEIAAQRLLWRSDVLDGRLPARAEAVAGGRELELWLDGALLCAAVDGHVLREDCSPVAGGGLPSLPKLSPGRHNVAVNVVWENGRDAIVDSFGGAARVTVLGDCDHVAALTSPLEGQRVPSIPATARLGVVVVPCDTSWARSVSREQLAATPFVCFRLEKQQPSCGRFVADAARPISVEYDARAARWERRPRAVHGERTAVAVSSWLVEVEVALPPGRQLLEVWLSDGDARGPYTSEQVHATCPSQVVVDATLHWEEDEERIRAAGASAMVVATGASERFMRQLTNCIASLRVWEPDVAVEVFDLGLSEASRERVASWPHTNVVEVPFEQLPPHVADLASYAWKPWAVNDTLSRHAHMLWIDANFEARRPLDDVRAKLASAGFFSVAQVGARGEVVQWPSANLDDVRTLRSVGCAATLSSRPLCAGGMQGWSAVGRLRSLVLDPLLRCAMEQDCITPPGSCVAARTALTAACADSSMGTSVPNIACHAQEQAVTQTRPDRVQRRAVCGRGAAPAGRGGAAVRHESEVDAVRRLVETRRQRAAGGAAPNPGRARLGSAAVRESASGRPRLAGISAARITAVMEFTWDLSRCTSTSRSPAAPASATTRAPWPPQHTRQRWR